MVIDSNTLHNITLFSTLNDAELAELITHTQNITVAPDQTIYGAGGSSSAMYMVLTGKVRIFVRDRYGRKATIAHATPGELFGEPGSLNGEMCSATAIALMETHLLVMERRSLAYLFSRKPDSALTVIGALEAHLRLAHRLLSKSKALPQ